ncbi:hypothetical protein GEMRC1_002392 [Eukaryota sp. GEM-RC1]
MSTSQESVFRTGILPLVQLFLQGYNCNVLLYGSTSSGKTYSTIGSFINPNEHGILLRSVVHIIDSLISSTTLSASFLELYNEQCFDLLSPSSEELPIREDPNGHSIVVGLSSHPLTSSSQALHLVRQAIDRRKTFATKKNPNSSRSHFLCTIELSSSSLHSYIRFADLAGSERAADTENVGQRMIEGANINKSLLALGSIINKLSNRSATSTVHIPFRSSKLTRILKAAFIGNSKTVLLSNITSSINSFEETLNTLNYSVRALGIDSTARVNDVTLNKLEVVHYEKMVEKLQDELRNEAGKRKEADFLRVQELQIRDEVILSAMKVLKVMSVDGIEIPESVTGRGYRVWLFKILKLLNSLQKTELSAFRPPSSPTRTPSTLDLVIGNDESSLVVEEEEVRVEDESSDGDGQIQSDHNHTPIPVRSSSILPKIPPSKPETTSDDDFSMLAIVPTKSFSMELPKEGQKIPAKRLPTSMLVRNGRGSRPRGVLRGRMFKKVFK